MDFVSKSIRKKFFYKKGFGFEAIEDISKNTVIVIETPLIDLFDIDIKHNSICEMLYIIYRSMNTNKFIKKQFLKLTPYHLENNKPIVQYKDLYKCINDLCDDKIKSYFKSLDKNELLLYTLKYSRNAFGYYIKNRRVPVILFHGAIFNHSCVPNVIFFAKDNKMYFVTTRDIKKGEEICDSYIDLALNKSERQNRLLNQYGFLCQCQRCKSNNKYYNILVKEIENFKKQIENNKHIMINL